MEIINAAISDHEILTTITKKSKAYWGFSEDILKEWEHLLTVTPDYIEKNAVFKLIQNDQIIGYYSRVPATLEEYFQPVEKRFYRRNQE